MKGFLHCLYYALECLFCRGVVLPVMFVVTNVVVICNYEHYGVPAVLLLLPCTFIMYAACGLIGTRLTMLADGCYNEWRQGFQCYVSKDALESFCGGLALVLTWALASALKAVNTASMAIWPLVLGQTLLATLLSWVFVRRAARIRYGPLG